jgi:hypothetical protein
MRRARSSLIRLQAIIEEDLIGQATASPDHAPHDENDQERNAA